jgi:hypothetical protein
MAFRGSLAPFQIPAERISTRAEKGRCGAAGKAPERQEEMGLSVQDASMVPSSPIPRGRPW